MSILVDQLVTLLQNDPAIKTVRIVNYDETPLGKLELKIRCRLIQKYQLQIWLHHEPAFQDYSFQLFTNQPILRWDNAPHYPQIATAPHHFHAADGTIHESPLAGSTLADLRYVLSEIKIWIV